MFRKVVISSKACAKVCAAIVCGTLAYKTMTTRPHYAAGYNYSRRFYPAAAEYPDISKNRNIMARNLSKAMYARLRDLRTPNGFTIDDVIQTGVDNVGTFSFTGCVAGDEETYEVFSELLNKVILERHGHAADDSHPPPDYDASKLRDGAFDPEFVLNIRMRVIRNLRGYCLPTFCTRGERRDIESVLVKALYAMDQQYKGTYYSLKELNAEEQITLAKNSVWMDRPYLPSEVSCNLGRDWPDARGIWQNNDRSLVAFLNRRDHIVLTLIHSGADFHSSFAKFFEFVRHFEESVRAQNWEIMRTKHLGNVTTDPKNLGTALKISVRIRLPKLSKDSRLQSLLKTYNLSQSYRIVDELQHSEDDFDLLDESTSKKDKSAVLEISSIYTLGKSEVEIGQSFIDSINKLIEAEKRLEVDEPIDQQIKSSNLS